MSVLHYTIGLPPERNGGSVQYAYGLMIEQSRTEKVYALVCGDTLLRGSICRFKNNGIRNGIETFKLTNPLTPTLIYGTSSPLSQHRDVKIDYDNIRGFVRAKGIKVMHLHTLMGIHRDVVEFIRSLGVTIVYTTHDFHGICAHYNLIDYNGELCRSASAERCAICNANEPSDRFLRMANSSLYHFVKKSGILSVLKKSKPAISKGCDDKNDVADERIEEYRGLLDYYKDYFKLVDKFHFNSSQTRDVFRHFIPDVTGKVIPVVTSGIRDKRKRISPDSIVKLGFIGSLNEYKGFQVLKKAFIDLYNLGVHNLKLNVYGGAMIGIDDDCPQIEYKPPYKYEDLSDIMYHLDGTVVPSKWYETFSLVTLESLAHGRPAFVSSHVGAKDIVASYGREYVFSSYEQLKGILKKISNDTSFMHNYSKMIMDKPWIFTIQNHVEEIIEFYKN